MTLSLEPVGNESGRAAAAQTAAARQARKAAKRGQARQREAFHRQMHGEVDVPALRTAVAAAVARAAEAPRQGEVMMAFPGQNLNRWVPIGPTVTRRGQAMSRPRVSGRIRDVAVSPDGARAYVISAKGGVWYSGDAGRTWQPVGGWATRSVNAAGNGNLFSGGSLLVDFAGGTAATDVVLVGTGEPSPSLDPTGGTQGGVGILYGRGPATAGIDADPWEPDVGPATLSGVGVYRLARRPGALASSTAAGTQDRVLAATTDGLYLGTRAALPAVPAAPPAAPGALAQDALPARDGFSWVACAAAPPNGPLAPRPITDVVWLANGGGTRIVFARDGRGVFFSDDEGGSRVPIAALQNPVGPGLSFAGRISLSQVPGTNRVYVLAELTTAPPPPAKAQRSARLWQLPDVVATPQTVVAVPGVPTDLFGDPTDPPTQADYDQALAVENVGGNDRIYLGGSTVEPQSGPQGEWSGSLFCFETPAPPAAVAALVPARGVSRRLNPPAGDGADRAGLIGNNVHADIHAIKLAGPAAPGRQVWVGCDGGVFVSEHSGRVNTFAAHNTGLATLEPNFVATHPSSSQFLFAGFQDNGSQVRVGDTVWEATFLGDGGGTVLHPIRSDLGVTQYLRGRWNGTPAADYVDPLTRQPGSAGDAGRESNAAAFYSGAAVVADTATTARLALGTNRVWLTDNLGTGTPVRWRALPYPNGTQTDARPGGTDPAPRRSFGVPGFVNPNLVTAAGNSFADQVIDLTWQNGSTLLAMYRGGLVRYTNTNKAAGTWTTRTWDLTSIIVPIPANATLTAVAALPAPSLDFYVSTLGDPANPATETLWYWDEAANTLRDTRFRASLDFPGPPTVTGPVDPVYAVAVDPTDGADVYVGTATGVWKGRRQVAGHWVFVPFMNGLPDATVQDLDIWTDPAGAATSPRLLRAGVQSRGFWEVDLARPDPRRTYLRVHENDDRRMLPSPLANPRRAPSAPPRVAFASPDLVIRPAWPLSTPPRLHAPISSANVAVYDLWTFQTAFRWLYPSCVADGIWSDAVRDLVQFHRSVLGLPPGDLINQALWDAVVGRRVGPAVQGGVRLRPDPTSPSRASVTTDPADPLAVYRAPWQTRFTFDGAGTEIDLMDTVRPVRTTNFEWTVFNERSTVDVLLHHRDSRPVPPGSAFAVLLWRFAPTLPELLALGAADLPPYLAAVVAAGAAAPPPAPAGWNVATDPAGAALRPLNTLLDARLPRAVSIDVDLSSPTVPAGSHVLLLALVGSGADDLIPPPAAAANLVDLVRAWPQAAMRIVQVRARV